MEEIVFNGVKYRDVADMPPEVRREFERILAAARQAPEGIRTVVTRKVVVNNREFGSVDELPPEQRALVEEAMARSTGGGGLKISRPDTGGLSFSFSTSRRAGQPPPGKSPTKSAPSDCGQNVAILQDRLRWAKTWIGILIVALILLALALVFLR